MGIYGIECGKSPAVPGAVVVQIGYTTIVRQRRRPQHTAPTLGTKGQRAKQPFSPHQHR